MEIKSLAGIEFDVLFMAFKQAFADYEVQQSKDQLRRMLNRRGFCPELSFAAFEGNDIVAFTFNGIGSFNGVSTAYDTGTGTLKEYRGRGLASDIFKYSIPYLKEKNIKQYLLEVLQHNEKAVSVYKKLGFEVTREFNYFTQANDKIKVTGKILGPHYEIKQIAVEEFVYISGFCDFYPSWQNSFESIERAASDFISLGVFVQDRLIGYGIFEPASGDVTQLAVDKQYRRKGIAGSLLSEMVKLNECPTIKVINTNVSCTSVTEFLKAMNIDVRGKQFEMILQL